MNRNIETKTVEEQIYRILLDDIRTLKLPPGSHVNEFKISEALQVSRSPVRDAIKRLKGDNLIVTVPNKGAFVRKPSGEELYEMYEARLMMEFYALDHSLCPLGEKTEQKLCSILEVARHAFERQNLSEYLPTDFSLHRTIISLCNNNYIGNMYENLNWQLYTVTLETEWDRLHFERVQSDHEKIVESIIDGKTAEAKEILKSHITRAREIVIERESK